uniref:RPA43 OB domain-containing protein n=1 Tax=Aureoumbra lagunensis TaxID=44058 RepID=A0A7S3K2D6_9STRA|mmetsp:Transcript_14955/g.22507  ORF Transcript_14955/g.22507 Transcript_14955/m.22507 type:complete len:209 (+) Transcript_14955:27-653(+)
MESPSKRKRRKRSSVDENLESSSSSFRIVHLIAEFSLLPHSLEDVRLHIFKLLQDSLMRYNERIAGVPISILDIQLAPNHKYGRIFGSDPKIRVTVHLTAHVFAPEPKHHLIGRVNKLESTFIGLLVHGLFNASIAATDMNGATYHNVSWRIPDENDHLIICMDSLVLFQVLRIHHDRGILALDGKFIRLLRSSSVTPLIPNGEEENT